MLQSRTLFLYQRAIDGIYRSYEGPRKGVKQKACAWAHDWFIARINFLEPALATLIQAVTDLVCALFCTLFLPFCYLSLFNRNLEDQISVINEYMMDGFQHLKIFLASSIGIFWPGLLEEKKNEEEEVEMVSNCRGFE